MYNKLDVLDASFKQQMSSMFEMPVYRENLFVICENHSLKQIFNSDLVKNRII